jgi:DNA-binding PadR family transcriptional regulator
MPEPVRVTAAVAKVLAVFLEDPTVPQYGLDLMRATDLASGTLYPIMTRLREAGWAEASWEQIDPDVEGRPARRYYRLTPDGVVAARTGVAELYQQLGRAQRHGLAAKPAPRRQAGPA